MSEAPLAYVDFERCIVLVNPDAPLPTDDRSEDQKRWDSMAIKCEVAECENGFYVDLREIHLLIGHDAYNVIDRAPVTTHPRTVNEDGMILTRVTSFHSVFSDRAYAEGIARRAFMLFKEARANWHKAGLEMKAIEHKRRIYGATHEQFDRYGVIVKPGATDW